MRAKIPPSAGTGTGHLAPPAQTPTPRHPAWQAPAATRVSDTGLNALTRRSAYKTHSVKDLALRSAALGLVALPGASARVPAASLKSQIAGSAPQGIDLPLALMANLAYSADGAPGSAYAEELAQSGWTALEAQDDHLVDSDGQKIAIDPASLNDAVTGFQARIFKNPQGGFVLAFAGTNAAQMGDDRADLGQAMGIPTEQYRQSTALALKMLEIAGDGNLGFTGHSLGGGLAANAALVTGQPAVTFNAAGLSNETLRAQGHEHPNDVREQTRGSGQIRSYSVAGDPLTTAQVHGAPGQMGTPLSTDITDPALSVDRLRDALPLHGGKGDNQQYVEGLRSGQVKPGLVENPHVQPAAILLGGPLFGLAPTTERTMQLTALGSAVTMGRNVVGDLRQQRQRMGEMFAALEQAPRPMNLLRKHGVVASAAMESAGSVDARLSELAGRGVTTLTDGLGAHVRRTGKKLGADPDRLQLIAHRAEFPGDAARARLEGLGAQVKNASAKGGTHVLHGVNRVADGADAAIGAVKRIARPKRGGVDAPNEGGQG